MHNNKSPFKNQDKRLYYQYLGFTNCVNLFSKEVLGIKHFDFKTEPISYEAFQSFSLDVKVPLGKRVEHFFEFYIQQTQRYKIVKKNVQVNHNKTTIGEFDFFLEDQGTGEIIHVEMVYKFYVYREHEEEIKRYHGPNRHDNLEDKLQKMETRQFPLLYNEYAQEALEGLDTSNITQQLCFLGNVFLDKEVEPQFECINEEAIAGSYMTFEAFCTESVYQDKAYFIPLKEDWLIEPKYGEVWYDYTESLKKIKAYFDTQVSLLLWIKDKQGVEKAFILK